VSELATPQADVDSLHAVGPSGTALSPQQLFRSLYDELHRMARRQLARERGREVIGPTTLLHETYLSISNGARCFPDESRFMGYAARTMRGLIIDFARQRRSQKRGGGLDITSLNESTALPEVDDRQLLQIGAAVDELSAQQPDLAQVVDLKFFCGFSFDDIAAMRGVCKRTVQRDWEKARAQLHRLLGTEVPPAS
jgi:RNA polymerase sigma factor (TIGR02999 family)